MPTTYTDLIATVRKQTKEVSLDELKRRLEAKEPITLLDVREKEEYRAGFIPGAVSIPRGFLEIQVEGRLPDKNAKIVAYCAGGTRSALAAEARGGARRRRRCMHPNLSPAALALGRRRRSPL
ncbi:MAG TPA: rhodanese-like domain-containing protein [Labilithrix sp.]|nr:rhodanese-like domain-containing protein [Labilithrix sp.]